jgi:hypothetical protein
MIEDVFKVMIIVEAANNGTTSQVVSYPFKEHAEECVDAIEKQSAYQTPIDGQSICAVRLYFR